MINFMLFYRFAMLEMKTCLFYILQKFNVQKSEKTVYPPKWDPRSMFTGYGIAFTQDNHAAVTCI